MSYCRFRNTSGDLSDCLDAMEEMLYNDGRDDYNEALSQSELRAMESIFEYALDIVEIFEDVHELATKAVEEDKSKY